MGNLALVKSEDFYGIECDFYGDGKEIWMTRNQIGTALEYTSPGSAIKNIHQRYKDRLDKYSRVAQIELPSGGSQKVTIYNRKGIMEICRHSDQPKADAFMDFTWDVMDSLFSGEAKLVSMTEYQRRTVAVRERSMELQEEGNRIKRAQMWERLAKKYSGTTYEQVLDAHATFELAGEYVIALPITREKTLSADDVGKLAGCSGNKVGRIANAHGLKTQQYGVWVLDKSPYSNKEVNSFRYYESVVPEIQRFLAVEGAQGYVTFPCENTAEQVKSQNKT